MVSAAPLLDPSVFAPGAPAPAPTTGPGSAAFEAWFAGSQIVADGAPLVCLHGTTADFSAFVAHAPVTVYRLDGEEIARLDSFDVNGDWTRRPAGFHYGALTDAVQLGAEAALAMRTREADAMAAYRREHRREQGSSDPLAARPGASTDDDADAADDRTDDTQRRLTDLRRLVGRTLTQATELRPSGDGHYFTPDPAYSFIRDIGQREGGRVLPVYLAIRNPVRLNALQIEHAGSAHWVAHYRALGYDGAIFSDHADLRRRGWNGATQIVAFDAHQIKSVFNVGTYDPANPDIRFRRDEGATLPSVLPAPVAPTPFTLPRGMGSGGLGHGALARHGLAQTSPPSPAQRAAAFDAWFQASHIRHADGRPRICYHGTRADFSIFRPHRGTEADPGWYGSGIYLTADPETASAYAGELAADAAELEEAGDRADAAPAPRVIAAYVSLQNPYVWPADRPAATTPEAARAIRAELEAAGYDGVVVPNAYADPAVASHWEVVAFHATQVKSAYNVGTFDPANDDIRFARAALAPAPASAPSPAPAVPAAMTPATGPAAIVTDRVTDSPAFRDWFGASRVVRNGAPQVVYHGRAEDFGRFDLTRAGEFGDRFADAAFFTSSPRVASGYAVRLRQNPQFMAMLADEEVSRQRWAKSAVDDGVHSPRYREVKAAHDVLAARRQAFAHAIHSFALPTEGANVVAAYLSLQDPLEVDAGGQLYYKDQITARAIAQALAEGRDGVIVRNVRDFASTETAEAADVFVVFDPVNIKSVHNVGSFSRADDDIRFARSRARALPAMSALPALPALPASEDDWAVWFAGSTVTDAAGAPLPVYHGADTPVAQFDTQPVHTAERRRLGAYFSASARFAGLYGAHLHTVYLQLRRPFDITGMDAHAAIAALPVSARLQRELRMAFRGRDYAQYGLLEAAQREDVRGALVAAGYDGVKYTEGHADAYIAFDPAQIRHAHAAPWAQTEAAARAQPTPPRTPTAGPEVQHAGTPVPRKEGALRDGEDAFEAWFRDSKVVDAYGEPLPALHGTFNDFDVFDTDSGTSEGAAFFTVSADVANVFADPLQWGQDPEDPEIRPNVVPVFLAIRNPLRLTQADVTEDGSHSFEAMRRAVRRAREAGHDGLHIVGYAEGGGVADQWAAFHPHQIKSLYNIGTYDVSNPDIRFARDASRPLPAPHGSTTLMHDRDRAAALRDWHAGSKITDPNGAPLVMFHGTKSDFFAYDIKRFGASDEGLLGPGFYFTYNPEEASSYALNDQYGQGDAPNVQPVYVSLNNPFMICQGQLPDGRTIRDLHKGIGVTAAGGRAVRALAEAGGHDGIVWTHRDGRILHAVAWHPAQIKSAIGNTGTYDPENADIRFARSATTQLPPEQPTPPAPAPARKRTDRDSCEP